jgi:hypothetical protein
VSVSGARTQDSPEKEFAGDVRVDSSNDDSGHKDEGESRFTRIRLEQGSDRRGGGVLTHVVVPYSGSDGKEDKLETSEGCESFWEVFGLFHLGDEGWIENLTNPQESDAIDQLRSCGSETRYLLEHSVQSIDKARSATRKTDRSPDGSKSRVIADHKL